MTISIKTAASLTGTALLFTSFFAFAPFASAHGGGANGVDPASPSCMGELARLHANGKNPGNNPDTKKGFGTNQPHPGLGGPYESIKDQAKAFKTYCNSDLDAE